MGLEIEIKVIFSLKQLCLYTLQVLYVLILSTFLTLAYSGSDRNVAS